MIHFSPDADNDVDEISFFISRDSIDAGLRWLKDLVFFEKTDEGIEILRVIHGARRWQREFGRDQLG